MKNPHPSLSLFLFAAIVTLSAPCSLAHAEAGEENNAIADARYVPDSCDQCVQACIDAWARGHKWCNGHWGERGVDCPPIPIEADNQCVSSCHRAKACKD